jgi:hypothetical protein
MPTSNWDFYRSQTGSVRKAEPAAIGQPALTEPPLWAASVDLTPSSLAIRIWAICVASRSTPIPFLGIGGLHCRRTRGPDGAAR